MTVVSPRNILGLACDTGFISCKEIVLPNDISNDVFVYVTLMCKLRVEVFNDMSLSH